MLAIGWREMFWAMTTGAVREWLRKRTERRRREALQRDLERSVRDELRGEGPTCGHSACSQSYIDTGDPVCVVAMGGAYGVCAGCREVSICGRTLCIACTDAASALEAFGSAVRALPAWTCGNPECRATALRHWLAGCCDSRWPGGACMWCEWMDGTTAPEVLARRARAAPTPCEISSHVVVSPVPMESLSSRVSPPVVGLAGELGVRTQLTAQPLVGRAGCRHRPPQECDDACPGWLVTADTGVVERCDTCERFGDDGEAIRHVEECLTEAAAGRGGEALRELREGIAGVLGVDPREPDLVGLVRAAVEGPDEPDESEAACSGCLEPATLRCFCGHLLCGGCAVLFVTRPPDDPGRRDRRRDFAAELIQAGRLLVLCADCFARREAERAELLIHGRAPIATAHGREGGNGD